MTTMTADRAEANLAALDAYLSGHDTSVLADDAVFTDTTTGMIWTGPDAIAGMLDWFYHGVFEAQVEDAKLIAGADGKSAVLDGTFVGVHKGEFAGVPATGRTVRIPLVVIYDLSDGKVTGGRVHFDVASFLAQANA